MDEYTAEAFSNREEPVPVVLGGHGAGPADRKTRFQGASSTPGPENDLSDEDATVSASPEKKGKSRSSLQDKLFSMLMKQIIPSDEIEDDIFETPGRKTPSSSYENRPGFSLPLMTSNFRRFNARIGVVFVFQNRIIQLLSWKTPTHTLSFLSVFTFFCLNPTLLAILPIVVVLFFIMVPAFIVRHPPPPIRLPTDAAAAYSLDGPPLAPPQQVKPASEMSRDFFRNMRDLQNCMEDFSQIHDQTIALVAPRTNFSNEPLSSALFLALFATGCVLFISSHLVPWRAIFLAAGWIGTCLGHPSVQQAIESLRKEDHVVSREKQLQGWLDRWISQDIVLDSAPETREVEIFELQRRDVGGGPSDEWEGWVFGPSPYDPLSPARIAGDRPRGARFFADVQPPHGWEWSDKKWALDLLSREWVEERMITGVEIETEGERWVYDLEEPTSTSASWAASSNTSTSSTATNGTKGTSNAPTHHDNKNNQHPFLSASTSVNASTTSLSPSIIKTPSSLSGSRGSTTSLSTIKTNATADSVASSSSLSNSKQSKSSKEQSKLAKEKERLEAKKEKIKDKKEKLYQQHTKVKDSKGSLSDAADLGRSSISTGSAGSSSVDGGGAAAAGSSNNTAMNPPKRGEWRRRRWIRLVKRKAVHHHHHQQPQQRINGNES